MSLLDPDIKDLRKKVRNNSETSDELSFYDLVFTMIVLGGIGCVLYVIF
ncbi:hypothetical protein NBRC116602_00030 [Hyphomicrobiales bacterium 4NK60-0047b]